MEKLLCPFEIQPKKYPNIKMNPSQCSDYKKADHCVFNEKRGLLKWI